MKLKMISNIMVICGVILLILSLLLPLKELNEHFNLTLNVGLWLFVLGSIIKFTLKREKEKN